MTVTLKEDHFSTVKRNQKYASKGERLTVISEHEKVLIVEGKSGRFAVKREKVIIE